MRVIAVVSQKGGSGKTTLSGHLAVQATLAGDGPVAIIDTDPQGSLAAWWNERKVEDPLFVKTTLPELRRAGVQMVIIDTPPAITMAIQEVIEVADYVIVPTKPSPHDLRAVGATVRLVERVNKPLVFVVNDATPRARITSEAAIALSQHGTVAPVTTHHRTDFASSMIDGRTVMELNPKSRSAAEIKGLWEYLVTRLQRQISSTAFHVHQARYDEPRAVAPQPTPQPTPQPAALPAPVPASEDVQVLPFDALINETERRYVAPSWVANTAEAKKSHPVIVEEDPVAPPAPVAASQHGYAPDPYHRQARGFGRRTHAS